VCYIISKYTYDKRQYGYGIAHILCIVGLTSITLLKQPDFGQTATIVSTSFILMFLAGYHYMYMVYTSMPVGIIGLYLIICKPYRLKRIISFLDPWSDPQGSGFQVIQSLIAIGSGGLQGRGLTQSKQKFFYLPMQHTDFIFSIIAEEIGFIGSGFLIGIYILFLYAGIRISMTMNDSFRHYATIGFVMLVSVQACINIFVTMGLIPTKGLSLPFVSFGSSSLIAHMIYFGIVSNCIDQDDTALESYYTYATRHI
jgi:cell division protein FtsW